ncbi:MAG: hypothetical protein LIQ31_10190 [Planctomycetes bacterium]|nr:hypothetical protein [Planctomycetota bacterium]
MGKNRRTTWRAWLLLVCILVPFTAQHAAAANREGWSEDFQYGYEHYRYLVSDSQQGITETSKIFSAPAPAPGEVNGRQYYYIIGTETPGQDWEKSAPAPWYRVEGDVTLTNSTYDQGSAWAYVRIYDTEVTITGSLNLAHAFDSLTTIPFSQQHFFHVMGNNFTVENDINIGSSASMDLSSGAPFLGDIPADLEAVVGGTLNIASGGLLNSVSAERTTANITTGSLVMNGKDNTGTTGNEYSYYSHIWMNNGTGSYSENGTFAFEVINDAVIDHGYIEINTEVGSFTVGGNTTMTNSVLRVGTLIVQDSNAAYDFDLSFGGDLSLTASKISSNNKEFSFTVGGAMTLADESDIDFRQLVEDFTVGGDVSLTNQSELYLRGTDYNIMIGGDMSLDASKFDAIADAMTIDGGLSLLNNSEFKLEGDLTVNGTLTISGDSKFSGITSDSTLTFRDDVTVTDTTWNLEGTVVIADDAGVAKNIYLTGASILANGPQYYSTFQSLTADTVFIQDASRLDVWRDFDAENTSFVFDTTAYNSLNSNVTMNDLEIKNGTIVFAGDTSTITGDTVIGGAQSTEAILTNHSYQE